MAEELVMNIKSNIKGVTKDTQDLNNTLSEQKQILLELQKEEIALQQKRANMTDYERSLSGVDKQLKHINLSIKDQKLAVKGLTQEQSQAVKEQKEYNKQSKETIADFSVMGVSLNSVKKSFSKIIPTAKAMFGTIRAGIMSTGIGALVIAVVSLMQHFKRSEAGQEKFERIMAAIGAVTSQVADAFANLGGIIIDTFTDPMPAMTKFGKGLLKFLKDPTGATRDMFVKATLSAQDFVDKTLEEVGALVEVTKMRQKAHHIDRELKTERAKANREINDLRLQAEDREKNSATERIALLRRAQKIEEDITAKEIKSKQLLVDAQVLEMAQGKNTIEQKDKLAKLQADLINLDTKKLRSQRLLQTQITTAINQEKAEKQAAIDADDAIWEKKIADNNKFNEDKLAAEDEAANKELALAQKVADKKKALQQDMFNNITSMLSSNLEAQENRIEAEYNKEIELAEANGKDTEAIEEKYEGKRKALAEKQKKLKIGLATIDMYQSVIAAYNQGMGVPPPAGLVLGPASAGLALAAGLANINSIMQTDVGGGGGGGVSGGTIDSGAPAPQMMSGAFELSGGVEPEAFKAYVVTDEMTSSQNQLANIRRRATI